MAKINAVIIGAGMIAGGYDANSSDEQVMSHIKAMQLSPDLNVTAIVDPDFKKAEAFTQRWRIPRAYSDIAECLKNEKPEWVTICSPNAFHVSHVETAVAAGVKAILCEKPIAMNAQDAQKLIELSQKKNVFLTVNYLRRWDVTLQKIVQDIRDQKYGKLKHGHVHYSKGVLHYASHAINWFQAFLDGNPEVKILRKKDFAIEGDSIADFQLSWPNQGTIDFLCFDHQVKNVFDIELTFEKGTVSLPGGGYQVNGAMGTITTTMKHVIKNVVESYQKNAELPFSLDQVLQTMRICEKIKEQICKL